MVSKAKTTNKTQSDKASELIKFVQDERKLSVTVVRELKKARALLEKTKGAVGRNTFVETDSGNHKKHERLQDLIERQISDITAIVGTAY